MRAMRVRDVLSCAALAALLAGASLARGQEGYFWLGAAGAEGGRAMVAGCRQCDDVPLALACERGGRQVSVALQIGLEAAEEGQLVEVAFAIDRDLFRRDGRLSFSELNGVYTPALALDWGDPLLVAMAAGREMELAVGPSRLAVPLAGSAQALAAMRGACAALPAVPPALAGPR